MSCNPPLCFRAIHVSKDHVDPEDSGDAEPQSSAPGKTELQIGFPGDAVSQIRVLGDAESQISFSGDAELRSEVSGDVELQISSTGDTDPRIRVPSDAEPQIRAGRKGSEEESVLGSWADDDGGVVWEPRAIAEAVNGIVVTEGPAGSICTDTRTARPGQWFLSLTGCNFDGHDFLQQAAEKQCAGVVANSVPPGWSRGFVRVEGDTLRALQALAADVRGRFWGPVVGITGSVGKTTVRAMTALALRNWSGHVHEARANLNNHVGVPLTLLRMHSRSVACVLELGMNHAGEILELAEIAKPDVRVILNVGPAHTENFPGGLEEVAAAKGEIFRNARPGDVCVVNGDDPLVMAVPIPAGVRVVRFPVQLCFVVVTRPVHFIQFPVNFIQWRDPW